VPVSLHHEQALWDGGATTVAGIDEVGRGALAGPVCVGVCALRRTAVWPEGLADSKKMTARARETMAAHLASFGHARAVGEATVAEINTYGIVAALRLAALRALTEVTHCGGRVDAVLLDGTHDWLTKPVATLMDHEGDEGMHHDFPPEVVDVPVSTVRRGDDVSVAIAAASVVAKVHRDAMMVSLAQQHPEYSWSSNKGYGSAAHIAALREHGPTVLHRTSWRLPGTGEDARG